MSSLFSTDESSSEKRARRRQEDLINKQEKAEARREAQLKRRQAASQRALRGRSFGRRSLISGGALNFLGGSSDTLG